MLSTYLTGQVSSATACTTGGTAAPDLGACHVYDAAVGGPSTSCFLDSAQRATRHERAVSSATAHGTGSTSPRAPRASARYSPRRCRSGALPSGSALSRGAPRLGCLYRSRESGARQPPSDGPAGVAVPAFLPAPPHPSCSLFPRKALRAPVFRVHSAEDAAEERQKREGARIACSIWSSNDETRSVPDMPLVAAASVPSNTTGAAQPAPPQTPRSTAALDSAGAGPFGPGRGRGGPATFPAQQRPPGESRRSSSAPFAVFGRCTAATSADLAAVSLGPNLLRRSWLKDQRGSCSSRSSAAAWPARMPPLPIPDENVKASLNTPQRRREVGRQ